MRRVVALLVLTVCHTIVWGQTYTVLNPGFEAEVLSDGSSTTSVPNWNKIGSSVTLNPTAAMFPSEAAEGQNIFSMSNSAQITQGLGTLLAGTYTLEAKVGLITDGVFNNTTFRLRGNTLLLVASSSSTPTPSPGTFVDWTLTYVVLPTNANASAIGTNLNILINASAATGTSAAFDDIRLSFVAVPEPSTYVLLGCTTLGGLLLWRQHRRRQELALQRVVG